MSARGAGHCITSSTKDARAFDKVQECLPVKCEESISRSCGRRWFGLPGWCAYNVGRTVAGTVTGRGRLPIASVLGSVTGSVDAAAFIGSRTSDVEPCAMLLHGTSLEMTVVAALSTTLDASPTGTGTERSARVFRGVGVVTSSLRAAAVLESSASVK